MVKRSMIYVDLLINLVIGGRVIVAHCTVNWGTINRGLTVDDDGTWRWHSLMMTLIDDDTHRLWYYLMMALIDDDSFSLVDNDTIW